LQKQKLFWAVPQMPESSSSEGRGPCSWRADIWPERLWTCSRRRRESSSSQRRGSPPVRAAPAAGSRAPSLPDSLAASRSARPWSPLGPTSANTSRSAFLF